MTTDKLDTNLETAEVKNTVELKFTDDVVKAFEYQYKLIKCFLKS
tara:strand:+ start:41 stop:175 length:135 start_codon:yes stop_codon:yes gene_type:complete